MPIIGPKPLSELSAGDTDLFGPKAVNLGRMIGWGMPVPGGFVEFTAATPDGGAGPAYRESMHFTALIDADQ